MWKRYSRATQATDDNRIRSMRFACWITKATNTHSEYTILIASVANASQIKGKAVPLQAWTVPEGSRKLRFPDFVTTARDGGRLSALRTGRLYPQEIPLVFISVRG